jgi:hypothetical protein
MNQAREIHLFGYPVEGVRDQHEADRCGDVLREVPSVVLNEHTVRLSSSGHALSGSL